MKKITLLLAAVFMASLCVSAQQLKNPKVAMPELGEGSTVPIVFWDCDANDYATSNTFEIDQTVTLAFDITGTNLLTWIQSAPVGVTRGIGIDAWLTGTGNPDIDDVHILMGRVDYRPMTEGSNVYAIDVNFAQTAANHNAVPAIRLTQVEGLQVWIRASLIGYGFKDDGTSTDLEWWDASMGNHIYDEVVLLTQPYTGTKKAADFFMDDFDDILSIGGGYTEIQGMAVHCLAPKVVSGIDNTVVDDSPVVDYEYYNLQGQKLSAQPADGVYIEKAIKENGTSVVTKVLETAK